VAKVTVTQCSGANAEQIYESQAPSGVLLLNVATNHLLLVATRLTMSNVQHLPGYRIDDDDDDLQSESVPPSSQPPTAESEGAADDSVFTTAHTESTSTMTTSQQQQSGDHIAAAVAPALPERPPVDEFADPKIAPLHAIFPDFDAAIL
jgi:hypothetical protein